VYDCALPNVHRWDLVGVKLGPALSLY